MRTIGTPIRHQVSLWISPLAQYSVAVLDNNDKPEGAFS